MAQSSFIGSHAAEITIRCKGWIFTVVKPKEHLDFSIASKKVRYAIYSEQVGNVSGEHYFKGYIEMGGPTKLGTMKLILENGHFVPWRGPREQAIANVRNSVNGTYVDGPWEYSYLGLTTRVPDAALPAPVEPSEMVIGSLKR